MKSLARKNAEYIAGRVDHCIAVLLADGCPQDIIDQMGMGELEESARAATATEDYSNQGYCFI